MPSRPHVLAIRRRYLGDVVLLGSFLRNLRLHWPEAKISVLVEPAYAGVLALNPDVDETLLRAGAGAGVAGLFAATCVGADSPMFSI